MKRLIFSDQCANKDLYILALPDSMNRWRIDSLYDYLNHPQSARKDKGYIPLPIDPFHFEQFRQLIIAPELTMNLEPVLIQNGSPLSRNDKIVLADKDTVIKIERAESDFKEIVGDVSVSKRNLMAFESCRDEICAAIDETLDLEFYELRTKENKRIVSFSEIVDHSDQNIADDEMLRVIWRLARILHTASFENITKILDDRQSRPGYAVWNNIANGFGGICAEKTAALGFICDVLGINYSHVIGSVAELPGNYEDQLKDYAESGGEIEVPAWAQHHLMEIHIAEQNYLVDTTNGNIPFMFLSDTESEKFLRSGIRARMVYNTEKIKLRKTTKITGDILLTLSEFHIPELHLQYIFKQGLGIQIFSEFFLGVYFDWGGQRSAVQENYYSSMAKKVGFPYPRFLHQNNLDSLPDEGLRKVLNEVLNALRCRYDRSEYTGDFTFVLQPIVDNFWKSPRVSEAVINKLGTVANIIQQ